MRQAILASLGALLSLTAFGQDLLQCINPDITRSLLMTARDAPDYVVTSAVPDRLGNLQAPAEFDWIGSRVAGFDTRAAWQTGLGTEPAHQAMAEALQRAGFTLRDGDSSGFQLRSPPLLTSFCNDAGTGVMIVRDVDGTRYVTLSLYEQLESRTCEEMLNPTAGLSFTRGFDLIPKIVTPPYVAISTRPGAMPTGTGSGSGDTYTNSIEVEGIDSMSGLVAELSDQIRAQGWIADASWSGALSAGSAWTRELEDGSRLAGKLTVQSIGSGYHELSFMLVPLN